MKEKKELSVNAKKALELLQQNPDGLTIADMKGLGFEEVNSSHLQALKTRELVDSETVEREVVTVVKRKVQLYKVKKGE